MGGEGDSSKQNSFLTILSYSEGKIEENFEI